MMWYINRESGDYHRKLYIDNLEIIFNIGTTHYMREWPGALATYNTLRVYFVMNIYFRVDCYPGDRV